MADSSRRASDAPAHVVPRQFVGVVFPEVAGYLQRGLDHGGWGDMTVPWLYQQCVEGKTGLVIDRYPNPETAMVIRFEQWRQGRMCNVLVLGGKPGARPRDWKRLLEWLKGFAGDHDARAIQFDSPRGFGRLLGAKPIYTAYMMEV